MGIVGAVGNFVGGGVGTAVGYAVVGASVGEVGGGVGAAVGYGVGSVADIIPKTAPVFKLSSSAMATNVLVVSAYATAAHKLVLMLDVSTVQAMPSDEVITRLVPPEETATKRPPPYVTDFQ